MTTKEDLILKTLKHILERDKFAQGMRDKRDNDLIEEINNKLEPKELSPCDMTNLDKMDREEDLINAKDGMEEKNE